MACIRVRGHDLDFDDGKGEQDRAAIVPQSLVALLHDHLYPVKRIHEEDGASGYGVVYVPDALASTYSNAEREEVWPCGSR